MSNKEDESSSNETYWTTHPVFTNLFKASIGLVITALIGWAGLTQKLYLDAIQANSRHAEQILKIKVENERETRAIIVENNSKLESLRKALRETQLEFAVLRLQYTSRDSITPLYTLKNLLNAIPAPSWCKDVQDNENIKVDGDYDIADINGKDDLAIRFINIHINDHYRVAYGITKEFYQGKTDFEVFPNKIAKAFYLNDLSVYLSKASLIVQEDVIDFEGNYITETFWKFYVDAGYGNAYICGVQATGYSAIYRSIPQGLP